MSLKKTVICIINFVILFVVSNSIVLAQQTKDAKLRGAVIDRHSGERLFGAAIQLVDHPDIGTTSDLDGKFSFKLPSGLHDIKVTFLGYKDTTFSINIKPKENRLVDVLLAPDVLMMGTLVVDANRIAKKIENIADLRDKERKSLDYYAADIHKIAILYKKEEEKDSTFLPFGFSERRVKMHFDAPNRYTEYVDARRSSKNFFSEYDFFATGGGPLDLNQNKVPISMLSEDMTVIGPVSVNAKEYYFYDESEADSTWPEGTILYKISPKKENTPLFYGKIWINENEGGILGIDVGANEYLNTSNGLYSVSDLHYKQNYKKHGKYWLPEQTELSAKISFLFSKEEILYEDVWKWNHYSFEKGEEVKDLLNAGAGTIVHKRADHRDSTYWAECADKRASHPRFEALNEAKEFKATSKLMKKGMQALSIGYRFPQIVERYWFSNPNDYYRFNRVEGHFLGFGFKNPLHPTKDYKFTAGYSFGQKLFEYSGQYYQAFGNWKIGPYLAAHKKTQYQFIDRNDYINPINMSDFRINTFDAGIRGKNEVNYYLSEGFETGLKKEFLGNSFVQLSYLNEKHSTLESKATHSILGKDLRTEDFYENEHPQHKAENVSFTAARFQLHLDTRKYQAYMMVRDFTTRNFGILVDGYYERGLTGRQFNRYRASIMSVMPMFYSSQLELKIYTGASDALTPEQKRFGMNGFVVDDYILQQPFIALPFNEAIGSRVSVARVIYRFGSSFSRAIPISFIRKSGVSLSMFCSAAILDQSNNLNPLLPGINDDKEATKQVEAGVLVTKIFGLFYVRMSKRLVGEYGTEFGIQAIF